MLKNNNTVRHLFKTLAYYPAKAWYALRGVYRHVRVTRPFTSLLGPQYVRSRDRIEIDLTYACNLRCLNCNRSVSQAPEKLHISRAMIQDFVAESIARCKRWKNIRLLGGEPTLHPEFLGILDDLLRYRKTVPSCVVEVVTNGNGKGVKAMLKKIPPGIMVENSAKTGNLQPGFGPFNAAPVDDPAYRFADYRNGCAVMRECGMALTPTGYYPCAVAGGIDRITNDRLGQANIPADDDDMLATADKLCRLCGHFREGHFIPENLRTPTLDQVTSPSWERLYDRWRSDKHKQRRNRTKKRPGAKIVRIHASPAAVSAEEKTRAVP